MSRETSSKDSLSLEQSTIPNNIVHFYIVP